MSDILYFCLIYEKGGVLRSKAGIEFSTSQNGHAERHLTPDRLSDYDGTCFTNLHIKFGISKI